MSDDGSNSDRERRRNNTSNNQSKEHMKGQDYNGNPQIYKSSRDGGGDYLTDSGQWGQYQQGQRTSTGAPPACDIVVTEAQDEGTSHLGQGDMLREMVKNKVMSIDISTFQ